MFKKNLLLPYLVIPCLLAACVSNHALAQDETELPLPPAPSENNAKPVAKNVADSEKKDAAEVKKKLQNLKLNPISGKTPYYVDKGVTMIPIRPICDFFGLDINYRSGLISISGMLPTPIAELEEKSE